MPINIRAHPAVRLVVFAGIFSLLLTGCLLEEKLIFYPVAAIERTPGDRGLAFEDVYFKTSDGERLNGWFIPHGQAGTTLLWFHGNAGNVGHRVENIALLHESVGINIFIFDYRGYGRSSGRASEAGTYADGEAALSYLRARQDVDRGRIVFFGRSLGAAVAAELAVRDRCQGIILESPFTSIQDIARAVFPFLPIGSLLRTRYDTVEKIKNIKCPLLVLHGDQDEIVPFAQGKGVFEAAPGPKEFYAISGARHNDTYLLGGRAYFAALRHFIESLPRPG